MFDSVPPTQGYARWYVTRIDIDIIISRTTDKKDRRRRADDDFGVHRVGTKAATKHQSKRKPTPSTTILRHPTNECTDPTAMMQQQTAKTATTVSGSNSSIVGVHDYTRLEASYQPNEYDVIIDPSHDTTTTTSSEFYNEYLLPSYMELNREGKYHHREQSHILLLDLIDAVESNGGRYLRRHHDRWIQVSPMMARMYNWHRLRGATMSNDDATTTKAKQQSNDGMEQQHDDDDAVDDSSLVTVVEGDQHR